MKRVAWFSILALGVLLLSLSVMFAQEKSQPAGAISPDSTQKLCKAMFQKNCSGCHGEKGQGVVGPNLTDKYWLHGGGLKSVVATVKSGVSGKGMISWDAVFSPTEIEQLSAYVLALQGTDPPKAKKPEGELYEGLKN